MKLKQLLQPKNIQNFIEGNYYIWKEKFLDMKIPQHIKEQAIYRAMLCEECLIRGTCIGCGCATPNVFFSPHKTDSYYRWHKMLPKEYWKTYKELHEIKLPKSFKEIIIEMDKSKLRYFKPQEFVMGGRIVFDKMDSDFLVLLDELRHRCEFPIRLLSTYRSPEYNKRIGGVKNSFHLRGRAVDIPVKDSHQRAIIVKHALYLGLTIGVMRTALHIDNRDEKYQKIFHYYTRYGRNEDEKKIDG